VKKATHCMSGHPLRWLTETLAICKPEHVGLWRSTGTYLVGESGPHIVALIDRVLTLEAALRDISESSWLPARKRATEALGSALAYFSDRAGGVSD
jgi:hypothetical protein